MRKQVLLKLAHWLAPPLFALPMAMLPQQLHADPWIPSAGHGVIEPMVRLNEANRSFPPDTFTSQTRPSSTKKEAQLRITGRHGIGHNLSIEYDLRAGWVDTIHYKHNRTKSSNAYGPEGEVVGLNYGWLQSRNLADSLTINVVFPAGSSTNGSTSGPSLGTDHWAIEPDNQLGLAYGPFTATLLTGARVFLDRGVTQLRADLWVGAAVGSRLRIAGTLFYVRTVNVRSQLPSSDLAELYNILRPGVEVGYKVSHNFKPFFAYEDYVAGKNIHAYRRFILGASFGY